MAAKQMVTLEGRTFALSHLDKVLWPDGTTKADVLEYYRLVSPVLIPQVRDRAATFVRTPTGSTGARMYVQSVPHGAPEWTPTVERPSRSKGAKAHVAVNDLPTLMAMVNLNCFELHTPQWNGRRGPAEHDRIVFDLDPGEGAGLAECGVVALALRERLRAAGLRAVPLTSGGKGLHVFTPVGRAPVDAAVGFAEQTARELALELPRLVTHVRGPAARAGGKVLVDWAQNIRSTTTAAPYTLRVAPRSPTVSAPLTWDEIEAGDLAGFASTPAVVLERLERYGDLTADLL